MSLVQRFIRDERGITAIEYALIATLVAMSVIIWAAVAGNKLNTTFSGIAGALNG
jgi:pilus assembly protein Flp/PilA